MHTPGLLARILERVRGRDQRLVRVPGNYPLLLVSYPRGEEGAASTLEDVYAHMLPGLSATTVKPYREMFPKLPPIVVVLLRRVNVCGCLGHHHPPGTESRLARRLQSDMGSAVGEIDVAYEAIRSWQPLPLSSLAAGGMGATLTDLHFQAALLAVTLHEMEHLAYPERGEREVRSASNEFYAAVMEELVREETGGGYGMAAKG